MQMFLGKVKFTKNLEEDNGATILFIAEKQQNTILNFFRVINCNRII